MKEAKNEEDKIIRVEWPIPEDETEPMVEVSWINKLLPSLSILQLSDVWLKTKKSFKWKAGKALVVGLDEKSIEFWEWGWWWNVTPIILTYDANLTVDLWTNLNYVLTLTGDCMLTLDNIVPWCVYQFLIIQDNVWWHNLTIAHPCYYQDWYTQDTTAWSHSKLIIDYINDEYYASISRYDKLTAYVVWQDYDWTTIWDWYFYYWDTPTYSWPTPTRAWYTFVWWTPTPWPIYWDMVYIATYELI